MKSPLLLVSALLLAPLVLSGAEPATAPTATPSAAAAALSPAQLTEGLRTGLGSIISQALSEGNLSVAAPSALAKVQAALGKTGNAETAKSFSDALSAAVTALAPQVSGLMQSSATGLKIEDPKAVLAGSSDAATQLLKKSAGPALREKLLPLVKQATASSGLATKAKDMLALAGPFASLGGGKAVSDLDGYVCDQVIAQGFALMAKKEAEVRANPSLLTNNALAQKVFAAFKK